MTDPYRTPPSGWKPDLREGSSFLKREVPPSVFERMSLLLKNEPRSPLAFGLGPAAMREFYKGCRAGSVPVHAPTERPTWNGVAVAWLTGYADPNEVRLVR